MKDLSNWARQRFGVILTESQLREMDAGEEPTYRLVGRIGQRWAIAGNEHRRAGHELRVVRPGGRIGMANWTPAGFIGQLFKVIGAHVPPPAGIRSPTVTDEKRPHQVAAMVSSTSVPPGRMSRPSSGQLESNSSQPPARASFRVSSAMNRTLASAPWRMRVTGSASGSEAALLPEPARMTELEISPGQFVRRGQVLARFRGDSLDEADLSGVELVAAEDLPAQPHQRIVPAVDHPLLYGVGAEGYGPSYMLVQAMQGTIVLEDRDPRFVGARGDDHLLVHGNSRNLRQTPRSPAGTRRRDR